MSRMNLAWLVVVPTLVLAGLVVAATAPPPDADYKLVRTVVDVLAEVDRSYVRELTPDEKQKMVEAMINGGLDKLDPHSQYFTADEFSQFMTQTDGQFGGVGIMILKDPKTGILKVESPIPGTPAYEAGVQSGDLIVKVNGQSTEAMTSEELRGQIKGKPGTPVALTLLREGTATPIDVTLDRAMIEIHPVKGFARNPADPLKWDWLADPEQKVALIRLTTFSEKSDGELRKAVAEAEAAGARALILDLRDNPGGLLTQAVAVADLFLTGGPVVSTATKRGPGGSLDPKRTLNAQAAGTVFEPAADRPMAVLVNRQSASASEIVAAALQDHKRAVLVGERSYGKGSVQKVFPLGRAAVKLTTEVWLTPNGKNIHRWPESKETDEWGVRPDPGLEVKLTDDQRREYIKRVVELDKVRGKPGQTPAAVPAPATPGYRDPVIDKAIEYLRGRLANPVARPA